MALMMTTPLSRGVLLLPARASSRRGRGPMATSFQIHARRHRGSPTAADAASATGWAKDHRENCELRVVRRRRRNCRWQQGADEIGMVGCAMMNRSLSSSSAADGTPSRTDGDGREHDGIDHPRMGAIRELFENIPVPRRRRRIDGGGDDDGTILDGAPPRLPSGAFRPKQSLGQNFLKDGKTVAKIVTAFADDAAEACVLDGDPTVRAVELGPGAGALTGPLFRTFGDDLRCIEIDGRAVKLLKKSHPDLRVTQADVLHVDYDALAAEEGGPLCVVGNLPYYITSQILFALADASHGRVVRSATVTMQWELAQRIVAPTNCKAYGILSVVFQLYADCNLHFKIPPTVFYPQPKVDSALVGLHFVGPERLRRRLGGVRPADLKTVLTAAFQQRRKTLRNSLKRLAREVCDGDRDRASDLLDSPPPSLRASVVRVLDEDEDADESSFAAESRELPPDWASKRPEQLTPGQMVELARLICGDYLSSGDGGSGSGGVESFPLGKKVWRKAKHGNQPA